VNNITKKIALLIIPILVLVIFASGCTSSNTTSTDTGDNDYTSTSNSDSGNTIIKIITNEEWSGSVGADSNTRSIDGTGNHQENMGSVNIVSASIQKQTNSTGMLKVQIVKNGEVIKEESTTAEYGVVTISASL
jgi:hypothetical protein